MAEIQPINPETASHNIATLFSQQYIDKLKKSNITSPDSNEINIAAEKATELYAIAYDTAFEYFTRKNKQN